MSSITPIANSNVGARAWSVPPELPYWILRFGAALCFIGHGAFGFIMAVWGLWTALLRPLSGEPFFDTIERAGNYGVPLALLLLSGLPRDARLCFASLRRPASTSTA
ncbi:MAG: hypothetical protein ACT4P6_16390 [Gemmatimonadaceae bacterium]